jgi:hypothetical protein
VKPDLGTRVFMLTVLAAGFSLGVIFGLGIGTRRFGALSLAVAFIAGMIGGVAVYLLTHGDDDDDDDSGDGPLKGGT